MAYRQLFPLINTIYGVFSVLPFSIEKNCWCRFLHTQDRCYPEIWLEKPENWHCAKCHPCSPSWKEDEV
jgi:ubiquitin C-terminal hydrolase